MDYQFSFNNTPTLTCTVHREEQFFFTCDLGMTGGQTWKSPKICLRTTECIDCQVTGKCIVLRTSDILFQSYNTSQTYSLWEIELQKLFLLDPGTTCLRSRCRTTGLTDYFQADSLRLVGVKGKLFHEKENE